MSALILIIAFIAGYFTIKFYFQCKTMQMIAILNIDICDINSAADRMSFMELAQECYKREVTLAKWRFLRYLRESRADDGPFVKKVGLILEDPNCTWEVLRNRRLKFKDCSISYVTEKGNITIRAPKEQCCGAQNRTVDETIILKNVPPKYLDDFWNLTYGNLFPGEY